MGTFDISFEQFKKHIFSLSLVTFVYFLTVGLSSLIFNGLVPIIGPFLHMTVLMIAMSIYIRIFMQIVNGKDSIVFNDATQEVISVAGKMFLLNFIKGILLAIVAIPCIVLNIVKLLACEPNSFDSIIGVFMSTFGIILVILIISIVMELILGFVNFVIVDNDFISMSFKDAIINGIKMMKGYRCRFIGIQIINTFLVFVGFLMLGVGIFFTSSLSFLLTLNLYKEAKDAYLGYGMKDKINNYADENQSSTENSVKFDDFLKKD